ncbi:putative short-chain dehydrogenase/reductase family protein [Aspergillus lucknowensis]|uniref:Short-chain dehydrogenase/reductase family protein n=1 Tax=Aspergillus lucknowensis TaxID=176173 RepID=A0ABR4M523_9EURO
MASFAWANLNPTNYIGGASFRPEQDIPDLSGKVVLVTGGNAGLGKETIRQILKHSPQKVFLAARSEEKAANAIAELKSSTPDASITWLPLDLSSTKSVQNAAEKFKSEASRLDILILNAGVMSLPPGETDLGHEIQLGTNHTGHFLLTKLLLPTLLRTAEEEPNSDVRIISLSSVGHNLAPSFDTILDQSKLKKCNTHARYGASKAANILFAAELARRYPSLTAVSLHPGLIATDLYGPIGKQNPIAAVGAKVLGAVGTQVEQGAWNQLWAAVGAKRGELVNGAYYVPVGNLKTYNRYANSEEMGKALWEWTEAELRRGGAKL